MLATPTATKKWREDFFLNEDKWTREVEISKKFLTVGGAIFLPTAGFNGRCVDSSRRSTLGSEFLSVYVI